MHHFDITPSPEKTRHNLKSKHVRRTWMLEPRLKLYSFFVLNFTNFASATSKGVGRLGDISSESLRSTIYIVVSSGLIRSPSPLSIFGCSTVIHSAERFFPWNIPPSNVSGAPVTAIAMGYQRGPRFMFQVPTTPSVPIRNPIIARIST